MKMGWWWWGLCGECEYECGDDGFGVDDGAWLLTRRTCWRPSRSRRILLFDSFFFKLWAEVVLRDWVV